MDDILDVDLLAFEQGTAAQRAAVVDGVRRSLATGFVYTRHDLSEDLLDTAYGMLAEFFTLPHDVKQRFVAPESHGQTGYTGLLVETAAASDVPDWKEMLNWGRELPEGHPLRARYPHRYGHQVLPESAIPGSTQLLTTFHERIEDLQRRFLRVIAEAIGCHESLFDEMTHNGATLTRAIRYPPMTESPGGSHVWAGAHGDINLITALPRATAPGLQVKVGDKWVDAVAPQGQVIINTGMMLERLTNGVIPTGIHRVVAAPGFSGERYSVVQFCHPTPWTLLTPLASCVNAEHPQRYSAMVSADSLDMVLYEINLIEHARRVGYRRAVNSMDKSQDVLLAIDIGDTKLAAGLMTMKGELLDRDDVEIDQSMKADALFGSLTEIAQAQLDRARSHHNARPVAVGVGCTGPVRPDVVAVSPTNIGAWRSFPLRSKLASVTSLNVYGDLGAKALALAEGWLGAAQRRESFLAMVVSSSVEGGIVLNGQLLDGASGNAGHVGHILVEPNGRRCLCGSRGCLEAEASGPAIEAITGRPPSEPTYEIMQRTGRLVGRAVASVCNLIDIDLAVVGGSIALGFGATFFNSAQETLDEHARLSFSRGARIIPARLGERGPLIGAGAVGLRGLRRAARAA